MLQSDPAVTYIGQWNFAVDIATTPIWPTPDLGSSFRRQDRVTTPVVFIHGDWDVSTPVENLLGLLPHFPYAYPIVVHRGAHNGAFYLLREHPEIKDAIYNFLRTGTANMLPTHVSLSRPEFIEPSFQPPKKKLNKRTH